MAEQQARLACADPFYWLTECTKTQDEQDSKNPFKPFPKHEYLRHVISVLEAESEVFIYKSRTMMMSWTVAGFAAHYAFTHPATAVVFMAPDEDRAVHDVKCCKILWENSPDILKERWKLAKPLDKQAYDRFELANKSWLVGIPGNPGKIRSLHPTIVVFDEAAFMADGEEAYNIAIATRCPKMISLSSAEMGWYNDIFLQSKPVDWPECQAA